MRRLRRDIDLSELSELLPSAGVLVVWTVLMFKSGGYEPGDWLPAGLVLVGLLGVTMMGRGRLLPPSPARAPLLLLAAFTGWCFASVLWSDAPGTAWEASNLMLVALAGVWTLSLAPWRTRTAGLLMLAFAGLAAIACLTALLSALVASDLTDRFVDFRFSPPLDYPNTTAAFGFMAALPALLLAARPDASVPAKAVGQGLATFLCAYALLPQSRGSILGGLAAIAILAVAVPFRWRLTLHALLLAVILVAAAGPIGDVYTAAAGSGKASDALGDALTAILLATAVAVGAGAALAVAEERVRLDPTHAHRARLAGFALAALVGVAVVGAGVAKSSSLSDTVGDQWRSLEHPGITYAGQRANASSGRLASADPLERYDYWRVSLDGFRANPLGGMGAGGFEHRYAESRRYPKPSRYPHNLVMKVVGDTGLVGGALLLAFLVLVARGLLVGLAAAPPRVRAITAGALAVLAYFLAHGLFDWLEAYPVLVGPAFGFPLVALVIRARADRERRRRRGGVPEDDGEPPRVAWVAAALGLVLAALSLLGPWLSLRYRDQASVAWRTNATLAYQDLDRAAGLDPLDPQAYVLKGVIALTRGDIAVAQQGFTRALDREDAWLAHFGLGAIAADSGDRALAVRELAAARRLNRRDAVLPGVAEQVLSARGLDPAVALRQVLTNSYADKERVS